DAVVVVVVEARRQQIGRVRTDRVDTVGRLGGRREQRQCKEVGPAFVERRPVRASQADSIADKTAADAMRKLVYQHRAVERAVACGGGAGPQEELKAAPCTVGAAAEVRVV